MATEFTKLVFKEKKNLFAQWPPEGTKRKYMIFFSSEPRKQSWPIILISTDIHSDKVRPEIMIMSGINRWRAVKIYRD